MTAADSTRKSFGELRCMVVPSVGDKVVWMLSVRWEARYFNLKSSKVVIDQKKAKKIELTFLNKGSSNLTTWNIKANIINTLTIIPTNKNKNLTEIL